MLHVYPWIKRNNVLEEETEVFPADSVQIGSVENHENNWLHHSVSV